MRAVLVLVASAWAAVVSAQTQNYTIDPATVDIGQRGTQTDKKMETEGLG
jgi:hypothetical protein